MEVKPGYKQTEVGVIPEEWDVAKISDLCRLVNGRGFKPFEWQTAGLPIIRIQNLNGSEDFNYYSGQYNPKILVEHGQLLFAWSGSRGTSFGPHVWNGVRALLNYHTWKVVVNKSSVTPDFLLHALRQLTSYIEDRAHGASALVHTQKWEMEKFPIVRPKSLSEQHAIAEALSDVDGLLGGLDRLIAKKRDLKQAAMQQLLTGQTRLPGFHGEWEVKRLGDLIVRLRKTNRPSAAGQPEGTYLFFTNSTKPCDKFLDEADFDTEAIIANTGGEAYFNYCHGAFSAMADCFVFESRISTRFLFFLLKSMEHQINEVAFTGSGIKHLDKKYFADIQLHLPPSRAEQTAIAEVLTEMDAELAALEQRREKTRALKQAMMQELLTGRIRLVGRN